jgi:hypothetical protein
MSDTLSGIKVRIADFQQTWFLVSGFRVQAPGDARKTQLFLKRVGFSLF